MDFKKIEIPTETVKLGKKEVKVNQYLPTAKKTELLDFLSVNCLNRQFIAQAEIDAYLNALIILHYTDLEVEFENTEELLEFYDYMEINDYVSIVIEAIPSIEYNSLISYYRSTVEDFKTFKSSSKSAIETFAQVIPELMEKISEISKEIDVEVLKNLSSISKSANMD